MHVCKILKKHLPVITQVSITYKKEKRKIEILQPNIINMNVNLIENEILSIIYYPRDIIILLLSALNRVTIRFHEDTSVYRAESRP